MGNLDCIEDKDVEPQQGFGEPIPKGKYRAEIASSEVVPTASGTGLICKCTALITEEPYSGRKVFINFNVKNPSDKAEMIGRGQLSALAAACLGRRGIPDDSSELHEKPFILSVDVEPASGEYAAKNKATGFYPLNGKVTRKEISELPASVAGDKLPF